MKSNKSSGSGYLIAKRGNTPICTIGSSDKPLPFNEWFGSFITKYVNLKLDLENVDNVIEQDESITIQIYSTENSLYIESFTIDYEKGPTLESITLSKIVSSFNIGADFVKPTVTAHYENGMSKDVTESAKFTGNDLTEEGCKNVTVSYSEVGKTVTTQYLIMVTNNIPSTSKYSLVTNIDDLHDGDKITIVGTEVTNSVTSYTAIEPYVSGNNCKKIDIPSPVGGTITTDVISNITLGKKEDNWTLFDGTYYLYAAGGTSDNNHLKGTNSADNLNAQWNISFSGDEAVIKTCDSNVVKHTIRYNRSNDLFSCYNGTQSPVYIYKLQTAKDDSLQKAQEYAVKLINSITCYNGEKIPTLNGTSWNMLSEEYGDLSSNVKTIFVEADYIISGSTVIPGETTNEVIANAVAKYDQLVSKYSATYSNFMNRNIADNSISINDRMTQESTAVIIVLIIISILSVGSYFYINKRKKYLN